MAILWFYLKLWAQSIFYSCINLSDKITVYDGKTASDKTSIIDVYCSEKMNKKIISSGPNLLIEFESSSNRTSNGFSAKYRFTAAQSRYHSVTSFIITVYQRTLPIYLHVAGSRLKTFITLITHINISFLYYYICIYCLATNL